jgi:hypothetical protein
MGSQFSEAHAFWLQMCLNRLQVEWHGAIIEEWRGVLTKEAISEAIKLASKALFSHVPKLAVAG